MEIILIKDVENLGKKDTVINVSSGYARNYLMPNKLAILADDSSLKLLEGKKKRETLKVEARKESFRQTAEKLDNLSVEIKADVGEEGKLFGSITAQDIVNAVKELVGIDLDKRQVVIDEPIKLAGKKEVKVRFSSDITAILSLLVSPK